MEEDQNIVRRRKGNRRRRRKPSKLAYALIFIVAALVAVAVTATVFLKVDKIIVSGSSIYESQQIIEASGINPGDNFLRINRNLASANICADLPYIESIRIMFRLPTTVEIAVIKANPAYLIRFNRGYIYADRSFKVLEVSPDSNKDKLLPIIIGAQVQKADPGYPVVFKDNDQEGEIQEIADAITLAGLNNITSIDISNSYEISVEYDDRINILMGTSLDAQSKIEDADAIIKTQLQQSDKGTLDVSTDNNWYTFSPD